MATPASPPPASGKRPTALQQTQFSGGWSYLLYALSLPVFVKAAVELFAGRFPSFAVTLGLFVLFVAGASLAGKGLRREAEFKSKKIAYAAGAPYKLMGGIVTAGATFLTGWLAARYNFFMAGAIAAGALLGYFLLIGFDARGEKGIAANAGISAQEVQEIVDEARAKLRALDESGKALRGPEFRDRLRGIVASAGNVLRLIEEDPRDVRRARKFLNVYLDSAKTVTEQYVATSAKAPSPEMETRFKALLDDMQAVCDEQYRKLLENDVLDLDVQIEVLQTRLKQEGAR